ncbi:hypothetical protein [Spirochaeta isovalerica]|uniref:Uncharacterized protein n=1 Tax=Spirochaeta isovalerica TaxID=150 RepID=A0A841RC67_9SPIO|nr:hypothetical protein [Spirochaeta isovalerica]MBB6481276.1 hypothetical protein [Spirochaeta isovalerica]
MNKFELNNDWKDRLNAERRKDLRLGLIPIIISILSFAIWMTLGITNGAWSAGLILIPISIFSLFMGSLKIIVFFQSRY